MLNGPPHRVLGSRYSVLGFSFVFSAFSAFSAVIITG
jgi:hypothetical protein